jgi:hypothetical protein
MATRRPIVLVSGVQSELPVGDNIDGALYQGQQVIAGSGLVGGGLFTTNPRLDVALATNSSGLYFTGDNKLGFNGQGLITLASNPSGVYYKPNNTLGFDGRGDNIQVLASGVGAVYRTIQDKSRDIVSVRDFGAVGDGVTNDTAAIQAALDSGANCVHIPAGSYRITGITVPSTVLEIRGIGKPTINVVAATNAVGFTVVQYYTRIYNLIIKSTGTNVDGLNTKGVVFGSDTTAAGYCWAESLELWNFSSRGIQVKQSIYMGLADIVCRSCYYGISIETANSIPTTTTSIDRCYITGSVRAINLSSCVVGTLKDCVLEYSGDSVTSDGALHIISGRNIAVINSYFEANGRNRVITNGSATFINVELGTAPSPDIINQSGLSASDRGFTTLLNSGVITRKNVIEEVGGKWSVVKSDSVTSIINCFDSGILAVGSDIDNGFHEFRKSGGSETTPITAFTTSSSNYPATIYQVTGAGGNGAATALILGKSSVTSRSINAGGTINASGADYAEYMEKAGDFVIAKGDICGVSADGLLTQKYAEAVSFAVKSTNPSYVGGDTWGNEDVIGKRPDASDSDAVAQWEADLEAARQKVDRIAFAGQVPVNVFGAIPGEYIVPVNDGDLIKGIPISDPTFEQYRAAVGKVIAIEPDGRARIIVKAI